MSHQRSKNILRVLSGIDPQAAAALDKGEDHSSLLFLSYLAALLTEHPVWSKQLAGMLGAERVAGHEWESGDILHTQLSTIFPLMVRSEP